MRVFWFKSTDGMSSEESKSTNQRQLTYTETSRADLPRIVASVWTNPTSHIRPKTVVSTHDCVCFIFSIISYELFNDQINWHLYVNFGDICTNVLADKYESMKFFQSKTDRIWNNYSNDVKTSFISQILPCKERKKTNVTHHFITRFIFIINFQITESRSKQYRISMIWPNALFNLESNESLSSQPIAWFFIKPW